MTSFNRYPANTTLRDKIGPATITPLMYEAMRVVTLSTTPNFMPIVKASLNGLQDNVSEVASISYGREDFLSTISRHVMTIKSITGMFGYNVTSDCADVMLDFLETTGRLDDAVLEMLTAFIKIVNVTLEPDCQEYDAKKHLLALKEACRRYRDKSEKIINA